MARHYGDLLTGFVVDEQDQALASSIEKLGLTVVIAPTVMVTLDDRVNLAQKVLDFVNRFKV